MSISEYLPNMQASYTWFFYLGIVFFITHILFYGITLNLSYFGILLIYIGARKPVLSNWFRNLLWFFIILDVYSNVSLLREKIDNQFFVPFDKNLKEGAETNKSKQEGEGEDEDDADE